MYILDVILTIKTPKNLSGVLSYFSPDPLKKGAFVRVSVGHIKVNAMVLDCRLVESEKMFIKKSAFQIKAIDRIISDTPVFSDKQFDLFFWFLNFYMADIGICAKTFLPNYLVNKKTPIKVKEAKKTQQTKNGVFSEFLVVGSNRLKFYKKEIQKCLNKKKQVLFLVPDLVLLKKYEKELKDFYPEILTSSISPKKYFSLWEKVRTKEKNFILSTRGGVFLDFSELGLVIVDKEEDSSYKSQDMLPYYQTKDVAKKIAELSFAKIIYGANVPTVESYYLVKDKLVEKDKKKHYFLTVDMRNEIYGGNYSILSYYLQGNLEDILRKNRQAILFISRRGSETFVFCRDCGWVEKCKNCEASLIHHKKIGLLCHYCGFKKEAPVVCPQCHGHKIKYFGAGTQKAKDEILKLFPNAKVKILDSEITPNLKDQEKIVKDFNLKKIDILVGTQLMFKWGFKLKADLSAVLSFDNILHLPDFKSQERVFNIAKNLSFISKQQEMILQTYTKDHYLISDISKKIDYDVFFSEEIKLREKFCYPPFSFLVKIIYKNKSIVQGENEVQKIKEKIVNLKIKEIEILGPALAYIPKIKNFYIWHIIIKIKDKKQELKIKKEITKALSEFEYVADINPESLL